MARTIWDTKSALKQRVNALAAEIESISMDVVRETMKGSPAPTLRDTENERLVSFLEAHLGFNVYRLNYEWFIRDANDESFGVGGHKTLAELLDAAEKLLTPEPEPTEDELLLTIAREAANGEHDGLVIGMDVDARPRINKSGVRNQWAFMEPIHHYRGCTKNGTLAECYAAYLAWKQAQR